MQPPRLFLDLLWGTSNDTARSCRALLDLFFSVVEALTFCLCVHFLRASMTLIR
jgi:hypothetical protein